MRIGFDVDGVLADFNASFIRRVVDITGRDLFPPRPFVIPCWDYPQHYGYTAEETSRVWDAVTADPTFWLSLEPYWYASTVLEQLRLLRLDGHDVYFVTSRPGVKAKTQTEVWLATHGGDFMDNPTVLISSAKGMCAKALNLDYYVDDRDVNCIDVRKQHNPARVFLLDSGWNQTINAANFGIERIETVSELMDVLHAAK